jgi:hypothetical protein
MEQVVRRGLINLGLCGWCSKPRADSKSTYFCKDCRAKATQWSREWRQRADDKGLCYSCGRMPQGRTRKCESCLKKAADRTVIWKHQIFKKIFDHYGRTCACCGESNLGLLSIDHINNDGYKQRINKKNNSGYSYYYKIVKDGFPNDLQILCFNCNCGKMRNKGICPHKQIMQEYLKDL